MTRPRKAYSLIETVAMFSLIAIVLLIAIGAMGTLHQARKAITAGWERRDLAHRLALQWRSDVHHAASVDQAEENHWVLRAAESDRTIHYRFQDKRITRDEQDGNGEVLRRDAYRLPGARRVEWQIEGERTPRLVALVVQVEAVSQDRSHEELRVEAVLSLFAGEPTPSEAAGGES